MERFHHSSLVTVVLMTTLLASGQSLELADYRENEESIVAAALRSRPEQVLSPTSVGHRLSCRLATQTAPDEPCHCRDFLRQNECCCVGAAVRQVPANLTRSVRQIFFLHTSLDLVERDDFELYDQLEVIVIEGSSTLQQFDADALRHLQRLRILSITGCPQLTEITGELLANNPDVKVLELRGNALSRMPRLRMTDANRQEVDIDLANNKIEYIGDRQVENVRARSIRLGNNALKEVGGYAFAGSQIVSLYLHNNPLVRVSRDAFKSILELHNLYLSHTSISELPTAGLKRIRTLHIEGVPTLKRLPSVLAFTELKAAYFTYPHHCCLFEHVDDTRAFENNAQEIHRRMCRLPDDKEASTEQKEARKKRMKRENPQEDLWALFFSNGKSKKQSNESSTEEEEDAEDEEFDGLPPYSSSELGAVQCREVEVVAAVRSFYQNISCTPVPDALNPCENIVGYTFLRRVAWLIWVAGVAGNAAVLVILFIAREKRLRLHYFYMANLAFADMLTAFYLAILTIQDWRTADEYYRYAVLWQTGPWCNVAGFLAIFSAQLSIIAMFLIAFEMCYNTKQCFYGRRLAWSTGVLLMAGGWVLAILTGLAPIFGFSSYSTNSICLPLSVLDTWDRGYLMTALIFNVLCFGATSVCYLAIYELLRNPATPSRAEDRQVIAKMVSIVVTDMLCWFPTLFFGLTALFGHVLISLSNAKIFLVLFFPINSFTNPFLYVFFTKVIQRKVRHKAMPVLRKITTSMRDLSMHSLNSFYHAQAPGQQPEEDHRFLGVTQMTSLNSSPRGSNSSQRTSSSNDTFDNTLTPRISVCVDDSSSPQPAPETCSPNALHPKKAISSAPFWRRPIRHPIRRIPEMSDLSEHSSEEAANSSSGGANPATSKTSSMSVVLQAAAQAIRGGFTRPHAQAQSTGGSGMNDSGRGSLASASALQPSILLEDDDAILLAPLVGAAQFVGCFVASTSSSPSTSAKLPRPPQKRRRSSTDLDSVQHCIVSHQNLQTPPKLIVHLCSDDDDETAV